ncbi:oligosaccharide flippase family protein [Proteus mirabilis]|uniref:oligosaccharide flippase family protein n=1 Tax=Proteus mirabilis TaxID=584 RepID=UPI0034D53594
MNSLIRIKNLKKYINSGLIQILSFLISGVIQILILYIIAKYFPPNAIGLISIISIINMFCLGLAESGVLNYILYKKNIDKYIFSSVQFLVLSISFFLFLILTLITSFLNIALIYKISLIISYLCFPLLSLGTIQYSILIRDYKFKKIFLIELFFRTSQLISIIILILIRTDFMLIYSISFFISYIVRLIIIRILTFRDNYITNKIKYLNINIIKEFKNYYFSQLGSNAINTVSSKIDEIIVGTYFNLTLLGSYFIIKQFSIQLLSAFFQLCRRLLMPILRKHSEKIKDIFIKQLIGIFVIILLINTLTFLVYNIFNHFNYSISFIDIKLFSVLFLIFSIKSLSANYQCAYFQLIGKPFKEFNWNLIQVTLTTISLFILSYYSLINDLNELIIFLFLLNSILYLYSNYFFRIAINIRFWLLSLVIYSIFSFIFINLII